MAREKSLAILLVLLPTLLCLTAGCDYARMTNDDSYDTYETILPLMPADSVSVTTGSTALRLTDPESMQNPLQAEPRVLSQGRLKYNQFCIHCHGARGNGFASVGQSFAPLPTDLARPEVQNRKQGVLFHRIAFGFRRHPPMLESMTQNDIWAVIAFMRNTNWTSPEKRPAP